MKLLVVNCGSTSLKFRRFDATGGGRPTPGVGGKVKWGGDGGAALEIDGREEAVSAAGAAEAAELVAKRFGEHGEIAAVAHRLVTGGEQLVRPTRLDDAATRTLRSLLALDPLHLGPALDAVEVMRRTVGGEQVGVFDTAFHAEMPEAARRYPIPRDLADRHGVRRYGAHGLAHRWMSERYAAVSGRGDHKLVTLQLGGGCSACAVDAGRSVETTMGLTPLEGLMMATRSGDVDPSLAAFLAAGEGVAVGEIVETLNRKSGLLGVSGRSGDVGKLLELRDDDPAARIAIDMYVHRIRKAVGAYLAVLNGAHAIVFGGGVGEHVPAIRSAVCDALRWLGVRLDTAANAAAVGNEARISADDSAVAVWVLPVDEEAVLARDAAVLLGQ